MSGQKTFTRLWFNLKSISCGVVHQGKSGLLLLEVSQGDAHGVNFTRWSQPEVQGPRKIHRLLSQAPRVGGDTHHEVQWWHLSMDQSAVAQGVAGSPSPHQATR